ncbi:MAG: hypothetical protein JWN44_4333 [Myxococcales bacterium]|nr:hypothetical protein [Myxococcales bacterium]
MFPDDERFLSADQVWRRRVVIAWSLFAGIAVMWDFSWCFVFNRMQTGGSDGDWRIVWELYGRIDRRFLEGDRYLLVVEIITGLGSLLNFYVVHQLRRGSRVRALIALFSVSIMDVYGTLIYFGSEALNGFQNVDTASFVHTWIVFAGLNSLWLVFPGWCIYEVVTDFAGSRRAQPASPARQRHRAVTV